MSSGTSSSLSGMVLSEGFSGLYTFFAVAAGCKCFWTWIVTLVFHLGIPFFIWYLSVVAWPAAFAVSLAYTILLTLYVFRVDFLRRSNGMTKRNNSNLHEDDDDDQDDRQDKDESNESDDFDDMMQMKDLNRSPYSVLMSLLYAVMVLSFAGPPAIVIFNVIPCGTGLYLPYQTRRENQYWITNETDLPSDAVREWYHKSSEPYFVFLNDVPQSYCDLPQRDELYFLAYHDMPAAKSWHQYERSPKVSLKVKQPNQIPTQANFVGNEQSYLSWLTPVNEDTCCVISYSAQANEEGIWCGNHETSFVHVDGTASQTGSLGPRFYISLRGVDGLLWFRYDHVEVEVGAGHHHGKAVASLDPKTGVITEYSTLSNEPLTHHHSTRRLDESSSSATKTSMYYHSTGRCYGADNVSRKRAIAGLLMMALPIVVASVWLWAKRGVPSSSLTLFVGAGLSIMFIAAFGTTGTGFKMAANFWMFVLGPIGVVISAILIVLNPRLYKPPLWWLVYGLSVPSAIWAILGILVFSFSDVMDPNNFYPETLLFPFSATILCFVPLAFVGALVKRKFLFTLAAIGIMSDTVFLTLSNIIFSRHSNNWALAVPVLLMEMIGLGLGFGMVLRHMTWFHTKLVHLLFNCAQHICALHQVKDDDDDDDGSNMDVTTTERLLQQEQPSHKSQSSYNGVVQGEDEAINGGMTESSNSPIV